MKTNIKTIYARIHEHILGSQETLGDLLDEIAAFKKELQEMPEPMGWKAALKEILGQ